MCEACSRLSDSMVLVNTHDHHGKTTYFIKKPLSQPTLSSQLSNLNQRLKNNPCRFFSSLLLNYSDIYKDLHPAKIRHPMLCRELRCLPRAGSLTMNRDNCVWPLRFFETWSCRQLRNPDGCKSWFRKFLPVSQPKPGPKFFEAVREQQHF